MIKRVFAKAKKAYEKVRGFVFRIWSRALFLVSLVVFIFSCSWLEEIGPVGLLQFLTFVITGSYVVLFLYANWDHIKK